MSERRTVTQTIATKYKRADKAAKMMILNELYAATEWHRNQASKALAAGTETETRQPSAPQARGLLYGADTAGALGFCWVVLVAPTGNRLAPVWASGSRMDRFEELDFTDETATLTDLTDSASFLATPTPTHGLHPADTASASPGRQ